MARSEFVKANEEIARKAVDIYQKIEGAVIGGYGKVEETVVGGYVKVEDAFVARCLARDGETVEEAKARLKEEQAQRSKE